MKHLSAYGFLIVAVRGEESALKCILLYSLFAQLYLNCLGSLLQFVNIYCHACLSPIGNVDFTRTDSQVVCPNNPVTLRCTVQRTRFLQWRINSTQLTCLPDATNGSVCSNGGGEAHAIITTVFRDPDNLATITSLLVINDIGGQVSVSCESQVTRVQDELRSASMLNDTYCSCKVLLCYTHHASLIPKIGEKAWYSLFMHVRKMLLYFP